MEASLHLPWSPDLRGQVLSLKSSMLKHETVIRTVMISLQRFDCKRVCKISTSAHYTGSIITLNKKATKKRKEGLEISSCFLLNYSTKEGISGWIVMILSPSQLTCSPGCWRTRPRWRGRRARWPRPAARPPCWQCTRSTRLFYLINLINLYLWSGQWWD